MLTPQKDHITVCVCTFRRRDMLHALLAALLSQRTDGLFEHSVVVVDNDSEQSARSTVEGFAGASLVPVSYLVEPMQNIALARNRAVAAARGGYVALIDDDEIPGESWLLELYSAIGGMGVDGVLAPVVPRYAVQPPSWVLKGRFFDRPAPAEGQVLLWTDTRSGNALLRREIFDRADDCFDPALGSGGEDRDFFKRKIRQGLVFAWTNRAVVEEWVPAERWRCGFLMKRALLRGKMSLRAGENRSINALGVAKSLVALALYAMALPFALFLGMHVLMNCVVRSCDHLGKLLACAGLTPVGETYLQASSAPPTR